MKKKYILLLLLGFFGMNISAQTLTQAKVLYEKGQYDQAKPAFKKFVKSQPNNGSYNLWYGVCCLKHRGSGGSYQVFRNSRKTSGCRWAALFGTGL